MTSSFWKSLSCAALLLLPSLASAEPRPAGVWFGARLSYAMPFGAYSNASDYEDARNFFSSLTPLQLDAGWRFSMGLEVGAYGQWGFTQAKDQCQDCYGHDVRYGLQASWHFAPKYASMLPWVGLSVGREIFVLEQQAFQATYSGWDAMLQFGADYRLKPCIEVGPVVGLDVGVFKHLDATFGGPTGSEDIRYQAAHYWVVFGLRGAVGSACADP